MARVFTFPVLLLLQNSKIIIAYSFYNKYFKVQDLLGFSYIFVVKDQNIYTKYSPHKI